jgi:hypothetical protein
MEKKVCMVCGQEYETNSILLDKRLRESMEKYTVTGLGACPKHQKLADDGYIALVGAKPSKADSLRAEDTERTGELAHIKKDAFYRIFKNVKLDPNKFPMVFVESDVMDVLKKLSEEVSVH